MKRLAAALCLLAAPLGAQDTEPVSLGLGAVLRALDKINGEVADLTLLAGQDAILGNSLAVELTECRYPEGNPAGDAYAFVTVTDLSDEAQVFSGWMIASSPALNALDHARYDIWVLRCKTI